ncbi:hypothetical protein IFM89_025842, partial [Coptis chinensis]
MIKKERHAVHPPVEHRWSLPGFGEAYNPPQIFQHELLQKNSINMFCKSSNPPFTAIELDHSDSGREGCTVTTLTVTAEPKNWRSAIKVAVHE